VPSSIDLEAVLGREPLAVSDADVLEVREIAPPGRAA
jgi:hypothetical protein